MSFAESDNPDAASVASYMQCSSTCNALPHDCLHGLSANGHH